MNNADLIVALLQSAGVRHGFGVPSGNVLPLMEAMRTGGIDFVLTAHEGSAGFAADVTARMTGVPGLCIATLGPGATNLATGVGCAYLDRSPLIAITCTLTEAQLGRRIQMWIDHAALFKPIVKASFTLRRGGIVETLNEALRIALAEPPGPVHLDLPEDVALAEASEAAVDPSTRSGRTATSVRAERVEAGTAAPVRAEHEAAVDPSTGSGRTATSVRAEPVEAGTAAPVRAERVEAGTSGSPGPGSVQRAAEILRRARRPIAVIGASAMRMQRSQALREFVERHRIPFASTTMAKGLIDETHPLALGCIERAKRQVQRRFIQERADLVIGLGYDTIEVEYEAWVGKLPVLHVDIERADVDQSVTLALELIGDLDASVAALAALDPVEQAWEQAELDAHRAAFERALRPHAAGAPSAHPTITASFDTLRTNGAETGAASFDTLRTNGAETGAASFDTLRTQPALAPHEAIDTVRRVLPREGVLAFDVGAHTHQIASQWTAYAPRTFLITNGWSSMGFGLPAAIAAKLARRDLPVVCIVGDGCFQMSCGEVAVAKRESLAIPFVVLDDGWLSLIKVKQERRSLEHFGTALDEHTPPAHYFGVPAIGVRTAGELDRALTRALRAAGPTVIEVAVDPTHYSETVYD